MKTKKILTIDDFHKEEIAPLLKKALATAKRGNLRVGRETEYNGSYFAGMNWNVTMRRASKRIYGIKVWLMDINLEETVYFTAELFVKDGGVNYIACFQRRGAAVAAIMDELTK